MSVLALSHWRTRPAARSKPLQKGAGPSEKRRVGHGEAESRASA